MIIFQKLNEIQFLVNNKFNYLPKSIKICIFGKK